MKKYYFYVLTALLAVFLLVGFTSCAGKQSAVTLEGQDRDVVLAKAEPIADNMFQAMNQRDYAAFARDLDAAMKKAMPEERFNQMMDTLDTKVGKYQSRQVSRVERVGQYYAVIYSAAFEQEANVAFRVVLTQSEPAQISGLWYDSPKLRK